MNMSHDFLGYNWDSTDNWNSLNDQEDYVEWKSSE
jgi:hypothetical protein